MSTSETVKPTVAIDSGQDKASELEKLFAAAKDENELLEFKNYELLFKIQELEQSLNQVASAKLQSGARPTPAALPESITGYSPEAPFDRLASTQKQNGTPTISMHAAEQVSGGWLSDSPTTGYWSDSELSASIRGANGGLELGLEQDTPAAQRRRLWSSAAAATTGRRQRRATWARTGRHSALEADESLFGKPADGSRKLPANTSHWRQLEICTLHDLDGRLITGAHHNGHGLPIRSTSNNNEEQAGREKVALRMPFGSISCLAELGSPGAANCDTLAPDSNQQSSQQLTVTTSDTLASRNMLPDGSSNGGNRSMLVKKPAAVANWRNSTTPVLRRAYAKLQQPNSKQQKSVSRSKSDLENQMNPETQTADDSSATNSTTTTTTVAGHSNFGFRQQLSGRQRAKSISNLSSASSSTTSSTTSQPSRDTSTTMSHPFVTKIPSLIGQSHGSSSDSSRPGLGGKRACSRSYSSLISGPEEQKAKSSTQQLACRGSTNKRLPGEANKCTQCISLEAKVGALTAERQQLCEQITELEELENDSRLMSQKLAQQLAGVGHQLAECKLELEKTCENKSKLQFQNKRLSFELKQRLESIEQLQCQLRRLQTKAALRHQLTLEPVATTKPEVSSDSGLAAKEQQFSGSGGWPSNSQHSDEDDSSSSSSSSSSPKDSGAGSVKSESCLDSVYAQSASDSQSEANWGDGKRSSSPGCAKTDSELACTVSSMSSSSFSSSSADESDHRAEQNPPEAAEAATGQLLLASSRQQVLHKKISTAKILRGSQLPTNRSSSLLVNNDSTAGDTSLGCGMEQARLVQVVSAEGETEEEEEEEEVERPPHHRAPVAKSVDEEQPVKAAAERPASGSQSIDSQLHALLIEQSAGGAGCESQKRPEVAGNSTAAIKRLEQEIAGLRTRLMQANTLNDNLVSELGGCGSNNKKQHQPVLPSQAKALLGGCTCAEAEAKARELLPSIGAGKRSIVYLNTGGGGSLKQVAAHEPHKSESSRFFQPVLDWQNEHQQQQLQQQLKADQTAARELLEFLRFLLDKMHFHHGRNLELVNENQKLALNALVASNNQRLNVISHSVAMAAGQLQPLRPPPRRRNRMQAVEQPAPPSVVSGGSSSAMGAAPTPTGRSATTSALQVAKQTLLSIVPIYHNNSARSQSASKNNKQKQEPALDENNNNNNLDNATTENNHPTSSSIKGSTAPPPPNGWVVLNQSAAPTLNSYNQVGAFPSHLNTSHQLQVNRQHNNVSVLQINRSTTGASDASSLMMESTNNRRIPHQPLVVGNQPLHSHPLAVSNAPSNTLEAQQFIKVHSLPSAAHNDDLDLDRYKARFNAQLMDLLTRQQWCENIISEKLRALEQRQHSLHFNSDNNNLHQHHLYLDAKLTSSKTSSSLNLANYENTSLISSASSQQQVVTHSQSWSIRDQVASSFC